MGVEAFNWNWSRCDQGYHDMMIQRRLRLRHWRPVLVPVAEVCRDCRVRWPL